MLLIEIIDSQSDLLEFTKVEIYVEKDLQIKLFHKETDSESVYLLPTYKSIEVIITEFYCFIMKLSWFEFQMLFNQFRSKKTSNHILGFVKSKNVKLGDVVRFSNGDCVKKELRGTLETVSFETLRFIKSFGEKGSPYYDCVYKPSIPQEELDNERLTEIVDAIVRYRKSEMAIPTDWIQEYNTIVERLKNNPK